MRQRIALAIGLFAVATLGGVATYALTRGQTPTPPPATGPVRPASHVAAAEKPPAPLHDVNKMSTEMRRLHLSARAGAEWLMRTDNSVNGRFLPGWLPAVNAPVESDNYLHQALATYSLAKAARYFGDERYLMKARQAILSLLAETGVDPADATCRCTTLPTIVVNRLAAAGLLLMAIHELQSPAKELLDQGEQLAQFIRKHQQADGSLRLSESGEVVNDPDAVQSYPGMALYGLMLSQRNRAAAWKQEAVAKSLPFYRQQWKANPSLPSASWLTLAFAECFVQKADRGTAEFVFEMSDWVCGCQYGAEARNPKWVGGFKGIAGGKPLLSAPRIDSAVNLEALAQACVVTRQVPDATRNARYRQCHTVGSMFLTTLQYSEANTLHFTPVYRPTLIGGFHPSHEDGNLRLDYTCHSISALMECLVCAESP